MSTAQVQPPLFHRDYNNNNLSFASDASGGSSQDQFNSSLKSSMSPSSASSNSALKQLSQQPLPLASRNVPSSRGGNGGNESLEEAYQRALSRIASLESSLEYQKVLHADQLKGLHEEVHRLQSICSDLNMRLVIKEGAAPSQTGSSPQKHRKGTMATLPKHTLSNGANSTLTASNLNPDVLGTSSESSIQPPSRASKAPGSLRMDANFMDVIGEKDGGSVIVHGDGQSKEGTIRAAKAEGAVAATTTVTGAHASELNEPLSLLLQKQKSKYVAVIERSQVDIKRYKGEVERLRSEASILKDVLAISTGIRFDAKDLKEAVTAYQNATMHAEMHRFAVKVGGVGAPPAAEKTAAGGSKAKTANNMKVLPPIEKKDDVKNTSTSSTLPDSTLHEEPRQFNEEELSILNSERQKIASELLQSPKINMGKMEREVGGGVGGTGDNISEESIASIPPIDMPIVSTKLSETFNKRVMGIQAIRKKQHKELFDRT